MRRSPETEKVKEFSSGAVTFDPVLRKGFYVLKQVSVYLFRGMNSSSSVSESKVINNENK